MKPLEAFYFATLMMAGTVHASSGPDLLATSTIASMGADNVRLVGSLVVGPAGVSSSGSHVLYCGPLVPIGTIADWRSPCPADCDWSTGVGTLDVRDLLCFTQRVLEGSEHADINGDGIIDAWDFMAFVNAFNGGCP